jgi:radical SAM protein with 4Fe4S-binding SPASM domain
MKTNLPISPHDRMRLYFRHDDFEHSPRYVFFEITQRQDADCSCWCRNESPDTLGELSGAEVRRLIDQIAEFPKPPTLVVTGGDPLARSDLFSQIEYAKAMGLQVKIDLVATPLVTRSALRHLRHAGVDMISLTLDGSDSVSHDVMHVPGSFARTLEILEDAHAAGIATEVRTSLTHDNATCLEPIAEIVAMHGVAVWTVVAPVPDNDDERFSYEEYEQLYERLWRLSLDQPLAIRTVSAPHYRRYVIQHQLPDSRPRWLRDPKGTPQVFLPPRVNDGRGMLFVGHTGLIHPSDAMKIVCGMFPLDHIVDVYQKSPIFARLRDPNGVEGKCRHCEFRGFCGGSRAHAYAKTGNPFAQDPDCKYVPVGMD